MIILFYNIFLLPIISLIISFLLKYNLSKSKLMIINLLGIFLSFFSSLLLVIFFIYNQEIFFEDIIYEWIKLSHLSINIGFICDRIVILMLFVVSLVSSLVHLYSIEYMRNDPNQLKFMQYLTLFTISMYILITANNLIQMFIGWEGVGVCSYLLINFWDTRIQANTSAMKAIITNRVGDVCLLLGFVLIYNDFGTFDYFSLFILSDLLDINFYILLLLFLGAVGKSAQLFLHVWLPDAMEGPTPVSALIHAATMVTAGIYLIIRCGVLFDLSPVCKKLILVVGGLTALFAGSTGMLQNDLKKVIAYSTCSQLGFMAAACGLGQYDVALFHLAMHAFFKALLFLSAGSIIHAFITEEQDIRRMGGLLNLMPITYCSMLIGSLALMGFPFTAGFYSKDLILENLFISNCPVSVFSLICCLLASVCTIFYSTRLIFLIFYTKPNMSSNILKNIHESSWIMLFPLIVLSFFSIFGGYFFKNIFIFKFNWFIEELPIYIKLFPFFLVLFFSLLSFFILYYFAKFKFLLNYPFIRSIYKFLIKKWYFDVLYAFISRKVLDFSFKFLFFLGDRGFLELFGPLGLVRVLNLILIRFKSLENNNIIGFLFIFIALVIIILVWFLIKLAN